MNSTQKLINMLKVEFGLSNKDIADQLYISERNVRHWLTGRHEMSKLYAETLVRRAKNGELTQSRSV